jgi:hypothetical protein
LKVTLLLADITLVSNAMLTTMLANGLDMNVSTSGSLLLRLSHHRNESSKQPPSKLGTLPSHLPVKPPNRSTSSCVLQQSWRVRTPLAGTPAALKLNASVPTGDGNSWFLPIEVEEVDPLIPRDRRRLVHPVGESRGHGPAPRRGSCRRPWTPQ